MVQDNDPNTTQGFLESPGDADEDITGFYVSRLGGVLRQINLDASTYTTINAKNLSDKRTAIQNALNGIS
ncbi:MAG: hypothetical protein ACW9XA_09045 [Candidatus Nitrosopumilus sp. bin_6a]